MQTSPELFHLFSDVIDLLGRFITEVFYSSEIVKLSLLFGRLYKFGNAICLQVFADSPFLPPPDLIWYKLGNFPILLVFNSLLC